MSNELLNYHIKDGEPCGDGATLDEIADYYGDVLSNAPRWISVEDQLPEKGLRTLVYAPELDETMKIRIIDSQFLKICSDVTHWMPLPAPPDAGKPHMEIPQLEADEAWQCPLCGDWFTDGETRCDNCGYSPDVGEEK